MPPKQNHGTGMTRGSSIRPRNDFGADRDRMSSQSHSEMDAAYYNLPEITWNTETFNFDADDFTNQDQFSMAMRNSMRASNDDANISAVQMQQSSGDQNEQAPPSPPKKVLRPCSHCGKTFSRSYDLNRHESSHSDERRFGCDYPGCNKKYKLRQDLKAHERSAHEGRGGGGAVVLGHWRGFEDRLYSM